MSGDDDDMNTNARVARAIAILGGIQEVERRRSRQFRDEALIELPAQKLWPGRGMSYMSASSVSSTMETAEPQDCV